MRLKGVVENIEIFLDLARLHDLFFFFSAAMACGNGVVSCFLPPIS